MNLLRWLWQQLFGAAKPVEVKVRFSDEEGLGRAPRSPTAYAKLRHDDVLSVEAWRGKQRLDRDRALKLARRLSEKDGFYSYATDFEYRLEDDVVDPENVPTGTDLTTIEIRCQIPPSDLDELES
jgi:hypothetical protein